MYEIPSFKLIILELLLFDSTPDEISMRVEVLEYDFIKILLVIKIGGKITYFLHVYLIT